jgi:hypothetical protein
MYFPEANALVPTVTDPLSKTPAFKSVLVTLEPDEVGLRQAPPRDAAAGAANGAGGRLPLEVVRGS